MPTDKQIEALAIVLFHNWPRERAPLGDLRELARQALEAAEQAAWQPIEDAPDDRQIAVWCPSREGLDELMAFCRHHPDAGFCVDEFREPTLYRIVEPPRKVTQPAGPSNQPRKL